MTGPVDSADRELQLAIHPEPSAVETAALVAILTALSAAEPHRAPVPENRSAWAASARPGRPLVGPRAGWRLSDRTFP